MRLFSYKLRNDTGFAPNPFWGHLTLATCKPSMRRSKRVGDWIAGFTSRSLCGDPVGEERLIYLMKVGEKIPTADYFRDKRFNSKIPNLSESLQVHRVGDNIYRPLCSHARSPNHFEQLRNPHHWDGSAGCGGSDTRIQDLSVQFVLIAIDYVYFGRNALHIPPALRPEIPRGQSAHGFRTHDSERARMFIDYVMQQAASEQIAGPPHGWPNGDESWRLKQ